MRPPRLTSSALLFVGHAAAFWPVWQWYGLRLADHSDQPWAMIALISVAACIYSRRECAVINQRAMMRAVLLLLVVYTLTWSWMPRLVQAGFAMASLACIVQISFATRLNACGWGLLGLSLPLLPSLEFYLNYPLRLVTGTLTVFLLRPAGFIVGLDGVALSWNQHLIAIDAPCSGIRMLWAGLYMALAVGCFMNLSPRRSAAMITIALALVIAGNALRASALFFSEAGLIHLPAGGHEFVGVIVFTAAAGALCLIITRGKADAACRT